MGKYNANSNNVYQELPGALPNGVWGVPAYFNNTVYYCDVNSTLKSFSISNGKLSSTPVHTAASFTYPGVLPSVSANGSSNGIVWAIENTGTAVLHAFLASDLTHEIYNSNQAANGRDHFGSGQQVHHAHDCRRESLCGDDQQRGRIRPAAVASASKYRSTTRQQHANAM